MPDVSESTPFDLSRFSESIRRRLYDRIVEIQFPPPDPSEPVAPEDLHRVAYQPDEAQLQVVFLFGRWFAFWRDLEEPDHRPERLRVELVRIEVSREKPADITLYEV